MGYSYSIVNLEKPLNVEYGCVQVKWFETLRDGFETRYFNDKNLEFSELRSESYGYGEEIYVPKKPWRHIFWILKQADLDKETKWRWIRGILFIASHKNHAFLIS